MRPNRDGKNILNFFTLLKYYPLTISVGTFFFGWFWSSAQNSVYVKFSTGENSNFFNPSGLQKSLNTNELR